MTFPCTYQIERTPPHLSFDHSDVKCFDLTRDMLVEIVGLFDNDENLFTRFALFSPRKASALSFAHDDSFFNPAFEFQLTDWAPDDDWSVDSNSGSKTAYKIQAYLKESENPLLAFDLLVNNSFIEEHLESIPLSFPLILPEHHPLWQAMETESFMQLLLVDWKRYDYTLTSCDVADYVIMPDDSLRTTLNVLMDAYLE